MSANHIQNEGDERTLAATGQTSNPGEPPVIRPDPLSPTEHRRRLRAELALAEAAESEHVVELAEPSVDEALVAQLLQGHLGEARLAARASTAESQQPKAKPVAATKASFDWTRFRREPALAVSLVAVFLAVILPVWLFRTGYHPSTPPPLAYTLVSYGDETTAGLEPQIPSTKEPPKAVPQLSLDSRLQIYLRPADPVREDLAVHAFLRSGKNIEPWAVTMERSASGVFQLRRKVRELPPLSPGRWELFFVVGFPNKIPNTQQLVQLLNDGIREEAHAGWQLLRGELSIIDVETKPL